MCEKIIALVNREKIVCIGNNIRICESYINQLYGINTNSVYFMKFNYDNLIHDYDDYEIMYVPEENVYLTVGEINLLKNSCKEEQGSIYYMKDEISKLMESEIFKYDENLLSEMEYIQTVLDKMNKKQNKYINENLFYNLDMDALHSAFILERENKGLPILFYKRIAI